MTDREKLIALMDAAREYADFECDKRDGCSCCPNDSRNEFCLTPYMVDHLLANGVTFATDNNVGGKWIPVTERLPDNYQRVLCFNYNGEYKVLRWNYIDWMWNSGIEWWEETYVTHWMPLPEPPMRKGENG